MNEKQFDQEFEIGAIVAKVAEDNAELLERLGSDYDENGVPYWDKWHETQKDFE